MSIKRELLNVQRGCINAPKKSDMDIPKINILNKDLPFCKPASLSICNIYVFNFQDVITLRYIIIS